LKTYTEKHHSYPDRFAVEPGQRAWTVACPGYRPPYPKFEELAGQPWRMPERASLEDAPKNPAGRTGIQGRGILGAWGANHAADPIITRTDPRSGGLLVLLVERGDSGELALPGGMVDPGERLSVTAARELQEETGLTIDMTDATPVHEGFVDDPRNTDHAWMETKVFHKHLDADTSSAIRGAPLQSRDAAETRGVRWVPVEEALTGIMYANHADLLRLALGRP
jgi:ADP-ribose pyrophosphatase